MYYVYVLENTEGALYFGYTQNLRRRLTEHRRKRVRSTKDSQWTLIYYEAYASKHDACMREQSIKKHGQAKRQLKERIRQSRRQSQS
jgi:putative endonuclease